MYGRDHRIQTFTQFCLHMFHSCVAWLLSSDGLTLQYSHIVTHDNSCWIFSLQCLCGTWLLVRAGKTGGISCFRFHPFFITSSGFSGTSTLYLGYASTNWAPCAFARVPCNHPSDHIIPHHVPPSVIPTIVWTHLTPRISIQVLPFGFHKGTFMHGVDLLPCFVDR